MSLYFTFLLIKKEAKKQEKLDKLIKKYKLGIFENEEDKELAKDIADDMSFNANMLLLNTITNSDKDFLWLIAYQQSTIIKQNNMIIRALERLEKK